MERYGIKVIEKDRLWRRIEITTQGLLDEARECRVVLARIEGELRGRAAAEAAIAEGGG